MMCVTLEEVVKFLIGPHYLTLLWKWWRVMLQMKARKVGRNLNPWVCTWRRTTSCQTRNIPIELGINETYVFIMLSLRYGEVLKNSHPTLIYTCFFQNTFRGKGRPSDHFLVAIRFHLDNWSVHAGVSLKAFVDLLAHRTRNAGTVDCCTRSWHLMQLIAATPGAGQTR